MFAFFERRIRPTALPGTAPPQGLIAFYWHFVRQSRHLFGAMFVTGLVVALIDTLIPVFIGKLVTLMQAEDRAAAFAAALPMLLAMAGAIVVGRPLAFVADSLVRNNAVLPGVTSLIRWQSHWHVVRQSWPFFQNDFAGRIANRVMQTGPAIRETMKAVDADVWCIQEVFRGRDAGDQAEELARDRVKALFGAEHANVQPHSGANANMAVYLGLLDHGDTVLGLRLDQGGQIGRAHV